MSMIRLGACAVARVGSEVVEHTPELDRRLRSRKREHHLALQAVAVRPIMSPGWLAALIAEQQRGRRRAREPVTGIDRSALFI
jgi:hypothetical protein